jgi:hypothetical protein
MPLNYWIIAHRISHAISFMDYSHRYIGSIFNKVIEDAKSILINLYKINLNRQNENKYLKALFHQIGTMKSAKNENLSRYGEFVHEITAQWILTNEIKFNSLPKSLKLYNKHIFGRADYSFYPVRNELNYQYWNDLLQKNANTYSYDLENIFGQLYDKILIV